MVEIRSKEELEAWLEDKPRDWAQVIAMRAALRAVPLGLRVIIEYPDTMDGFAFALFRASVIAWAAHNFPAYNMANAAFLGSEAAYDVASVADERDKAAANVAAAVAYAANAAATIDADMRLSYAALAAATVTEAAYSFSADYDSSTLWEALISDCDWLLEHAAYQNAVRTMTRRGLWLGQSPKFWTATKAQALDSLLIQDPSYRVWTDWFDRRVRGERAAFDIPGDKGRKEDKAILARLADASDEDFWVKGAHYVNTTLQGWIDEARARVKPPERGTGIPTQNPNAITFKPTGSGRIAIDADASIDAVRKDSEARDRHAEAIAEAKALSAACQGSNSGGRIMRLLDNYLAAAGETVEDLRPSQFVQRGERLRQELAAYEEADNDLPPLTSAMLADFKGWRSAHNMVVGLDPVLMAMDTAQVGPDAVPAPVSPDEVRMIARGADADGVLEDGVREVIEEAADLSPSPPVPGDRRTVWSTETTRNLVIEAFSLTLNYPAKSLGVAVMSGVAVKTAGAGLILGAWPAANFLMKHRDWIETRLGNSPTWQALFLDLCEWIEKNTPIKPGKD